MAALLNEQMACHLCRATRYWTWEPNSLREARMQGGSLAALRLNGKEPYDFSQNGEGELLEHRQLIDDAKSEGIS